MADHPAAFPSRKRGPQRVLRRVGDWIAASPAEVVGLGILLLASSVITAAAVASAAARPDDGMRTPVASTLPPAGLESTAAVTVHVAGAVNEPGLVTLAVDARVGDAIHAAGGPAGDADLGQVNLARPLSDGEQVWVPRFGADPQRSAVAGDGRININRADVPELETLPGIGPARAQQIVDYRTEHGPFVVPGDLRAVSGIGEATFQQLAELVTVGVNTPDPGTEVAPPRPAVGAVGVWATASAVAAGAATTVAMPTGGRPAMWLAVVAASALVAGAMFWHARRTHEALGVLPLIVTTLVVIVAVAARAATTDDGLLPLLADHGGRVDVELTIAREPRLDGTAWRAIVDVDRVDGRATDERAALIADGPVPGLGTRWRVTASAQPLGDDGFGDWLRQHHATVLLTGYERDQLAAAGWLARSTETVRARVRAAAIRTAQDRRAGLLVGLVTGDTRLLDAEDRAAMERTGTTHLTAVSGANVAIVAAAALAVGRVLRLRAWPQRVLTAVSIAWFAVLTRLEPSVLRAAGLAAVVLVVATRGTPRDTRHALAVVALVLLLIDPWLVRSVGLLLSVAAAAGIVTLAPRIRARLWRIPRRMAGVVAVTVAAQIAVTPVLLVAFDTVAVASIPANLVAVPAAMGASVLAFIASAIAVVHVPAAGWIFAGAQWPAEVVLTTARTFAGVDAVVALDDPPALLLAAGAAIWVLSPTRHRAARGGVLLVAIAVVWLVAVRVAGGLPPAELTVTAIDVGQASAVLVETPRARLLVDAGADGTAARWLRRHGRTRLDALIVTHGHADHVGGAAAVIDRLHVAGVWLHPFERDTERTAALRAAAAAHGTPVVTVAAGASAVLGDVAIEVLHPPRGRPMRGSAREVNDMSLVVRIADTHGRRVLVTGDIEIAAQQLLIARRSVQLAADILVVPHHGAATTSRDFLAAVDGCVAMISAGAGNDHGHPHPDTLAMLAAHRYAVLRTDVEGTVTATVPAGCRAPQ